MVQGKARSVEISIAVQAWSDEKRQLLWRQARSGSININNEHGGSVEEGRSRERRGCEGSKGGDDSRGKLKKLSTRFTMLNTNKRVVEGKIRQMES